MTRLEIAARLLANSPWVTAAGGQSELVRQALRLSDDLLYQEQATRPLPPLEKKWFPGIRRFFKFLIERIYR